MHMYSESVRVPFLFLHHLRPGNPSVGLARQPCSYSNSGASVSVADPLDVKPMAAVEPCEEFTYGHTNMDTEMNLFIHPFIYLHGSGQPYVYLMKFPAKNTVCNCMYIHIYIYYIYGYGQPYPRLICLPLRGICGSGQPYINMMKSLQKILYVHTYIPIYMVLANPTHASSAYHCGASVVWSVSLTLVM
jgi:hypothetical protein